MKKKEKSEGYWTIRDNRLFELNKFLENYDAFIGMSKNKTLMSIKRSFKIYGDDLNAAIKELGYDLSLVTGVNYREIFRDFKNLELEIKKFIDTHKRFPVSKDFRYEIKADHAVIKFHGGIDKIKEKMNYKNEFDLIDDSGWNNKSTYEYIVAQFLIKNKIIYKRDQYPFPDSRHTSDFCIYLNGDAIHCEVWAERKNTQGNFFNYKKVHDKKIKQYKKHNIEYLSIYPDIFLRSVNKINEELHNIFKGFVGQKENITYDDLSSINNNPRMINYINDEILLEDIKQYITEDGFLQPPSLLKETVYGTALYRYIVNKYDSYYNFSKEIEVPILRDNKYQKLRQGYWTKNIVFNKFSYMVNTYGKLLNTSELRKINNDEELLGIVHILGKFGGYKKLKNEYVELFQYS